MRRTLRVGVVRLRWRALVVPERYPVLTMVCQAIGSAVLAAEAVHAYRPEIFFDTVGRVVTPGGCQIGYMDILYWLSSIGVLTAK